MNLLWCELFVVGGHASELKVKITFERIINPKTQVKFQFYIA